MLSDAHEPTRTEFRTYGLQSILITVFLILALVPLAFVSWQAYTQAYSDLRTTAVDELRTSSSLTVDTIEHWTQLQFANLRYQSESDQIQNEYKRWRSQQQKGFDPSHARTHLTKLTEHHPLAYDAFFISSQQQVLSSSRDEKNIYDFFARSAGADKNVPFAETLKTPFFKIALFPGESPHILGVLYTPFPSNDGGYGLRIELNQLYKMLSIAASKKNSSQHYLVDKESLLLLSPIQNNWDEVLNRYIRTYGTTRQLTLARDSAITEQYIGPSGKKVYGLQTIVDSPLANWLLVSEVEKETILEPAHLLGIFTLSLIACTAVFVILAAVYLAKGITKPLKILSDVADKASQGIFTQPRKELNLSREVSDLYDAFNNMIALREVYETSITDGTKQLEMVLESTEVGLWDWQLLTDGTEVNERWANMLGYKLEELSPVTVNTWIKLAHPGDMHQSNLALKGHFSGRLPRYACEIRMRHKQGHWVWVAVTGKVFEWRDDGKPKRMVGTHLDITQTKIREAELIKAKEDAEHAGKAKSEFLACMSHEIRTPMNGVLGMVRLLDNSPLSRKQKHQLRNIHKSAQSLLSIINDILDFSKIEAGKMEMEQVPLHLPSLIREVNENLKASAKEKQLTIHTSIEHIKHPYALGDPNRIKQIFYNLIGNAIKFTNTGKIDITCTERTDSSFVTYQCAVKDTGIGVPSAKVATLFDAFNQVDASTTRYYGGTGLGLAIVKKLCLLMQGDVDVKSTEGEGSEFSFHIRLEKIDKTLYAQAEQNDSEARHIETNVNNSELRHIDSNDLIAPEINQTTIAWPKQTQILLVEDNLVNQEVALGMLEDIGLSADIADNGAIALEKLKDDTIPPYSLILMDCQMPELDGYETTKYIRGGATGIKTSAIPIIAMTANAMKGDREKCLASGMSDYISKPIDPDTLLGVLRKWLLEEGVEHIVQQTPDTTEQIGDRQDTLNNVLWDRDMLVKRMKNHESRVITLIKMVTYDYEETLNQLDKLINKQDVEAIRHFAHTQKGVFGNLNAYRASYAATTLFEQCRIQDFSAVHSAAIGFREALHATMACFKAYLD